MRDLKRLEQDLKHALPRKITDEEWWDLFKLCERYQVAPDPVLVAQVGQEARPLLMPLLEKKTHLLGLLRLSIQYGDMSNYNVAQEAWTYCVLVIDLKDPSLLPPLRSKIDQASRTLAGGVPSDALYGVALASSTLRSWGLSHDETDTVMTYLNGLTSMRSTLRKFSLETLNRYIKGLIERDLGIVTDQVAAYRFDILFLYRGLSLACVRAMRTVALHQEGLLGRDFWLSFSDAVFSEGGQRRRDLETSLIRAAANLSEGT